MMLKFHSEILNPFDLTLLLNVDFWLLLFSIFGILLPYMILVQELI